MVAKAQKTSQIVYTKLTSSKSILPTQTQQKWTEECNIKGDKCIKWYETYQLALKCTKSTRLVEFQFKFLHRRILTNDFLTKTDCNKDDPNCSFCNEELEKLTHLFWSCFKVTTLLEFLNSTTYFITNDRTKLQNNISMGFGLTPDASKSHNQINSVYDQPDIILGYGKIRKPLPLYKTFYIILNQLFYWS